MNFFYYGTAFLYHLFLFICPLAGSSKEPYLGNSEWENRVYLATYPRSGNHWMRYLIEEATGIITSSTSQDADPPHDPIPYPWGAYCCPLGYTGKAMPPTKGQPYVVKTHFPTFTQGKIKSRSLSYTKSVRIIRHPVDSFFSFFHYLNPRSQPKELVLSKETLRSFISSWRLFQEYWDKEENVLTIRYEDLYKYPKIYLTIVINYIGYAVQEKDIERAIAKYPPTGGCLKHLHHYTTEHLQQIEDGLKDLLQKYGYTSREVLFY